MKHIKRREQFRAIDVDVTFAGKRVLFISKIRKMLSFPGDGEGPAYILFLSYIFYTKHSLKIKNLCTFIYKM